MRSQARSMEVVYLLLMVDIFCNVFLFCILPYIFNSKLPHGKLILCTCAGRTSMLSVCLGAAALLLCWQMVSPAFIQPKQNRGLEAAAPAALGALASMAGTMPAEALKGPLAGTDLCTKPLIYLIYPLCDPLFLVCPLYNFPLVLGFFAALVTVINLILPETQPDEDLRVGRQL